MRFIASPAENKTTSTAKGTNVLRNTREKKRGLERHSNPNPRRSKSTVEETTVRTPFIHESRRWNTAETSGKLTATELSI